MFKCKHKLKEKLFNVTETAKFNAGDQSIAYDVGEITIFKCHDCHCIIWENRKNEKE